VLVSTHVGIADVVGREHCGQVFEPTVDGLCRAIESLRADYQAHAVRARPAAERHFDLRECLRQHEYLYRETLADGNP